MPKIVTLKEYQVKGAKGLDIRKSHAKELIERLEKRKEARTDKKEVDRLDKLIERHKAHLESLDVIDTNSIAALKFEKGQEKLKPITKVMPIENDFIKKK